MEEAFAKHGTTGFLATMATNSNEVMHRGVEAAHTFRQSHKSNGSWWGLHFEGPFLNPVRRGAHPAEFIQQCTVSTARDLTHGASGVVRMMTVAPESAEPEALKVIQDAGIILSCGHSNATCDEGVWAFTAGNVKAATHLYNAMPQMHHREPGLVAAILEVKPFTSIVADGIHVNYTMVRLAKRELGVRLFLITDAVTSTADGLYPHQLQGDRYTMPDGTLSGSSLSMLQAVRNCVEHCDIPIIEAVRMASLYPAQVLGVDDKKGGIREGLDADLVVFDDDWAVARTYINGVCVYYKPD